MKIIISHPTGNANVRAAANAFLEAGILDSFFTTIALFPDHKKNKSFLKDFQRRIYTLELKPFTRTCPFIEILRLLSLKAGLLNLTNNQHGIFSIDAVCSNLDKRVAENVKKNSSKKNKATCIYAYEDIAWQSFTEGKKTGLTCFYDLPIGYWRSAIKIFTEEKEKWPQWESTLTGLKDSTKKLERKDKELQMADKIFVASSFTAKTLKEFPGKLAPIEIIPYGFPEVAEFKDFSNYRSRKTLKLLFVGGLSQRKGIANMFAAVEKFSNHIELTVVGQKVTSECNALNSALSKHRWIPSLSHSEVLKLMRTQDVLIFPSLFEGFGLVITEAMSQGTPVITTERTVGPDLIENNSNGWIVNAGETEQLKNVIERLLIDRNLVKKASENAWETARNRPWKMYADELMAAIKKSSQPV